MMKENEHSPAVIHAAELEARSTYAPAVSSFLTPAEQAELSRMRGTCPSLFFFGGVVGAERRAAVFLPEWAAEGAPVGDIFSDAREQYVHSLAYGPDAALPEIGESIRLLKICGSTHRELSHKDYLGSLMALGLNRSAAGDIFVTDKYSAVAAVSGKIADFVCENLKKVATDAVRVDVLGDPENFSFERKFEERVLTVASMRLDCVVAAITGLSRTNTLELIERDAVEVSYTPAASPSQNVREGDELTVRGYGKFIVYSDEGLTRKSRIRLTVRRYV